MGTYPLIPHPDTPPNRIHGIEARWFEPGDAKLILRWQVKGVDALFIPSFAGKGRGDELWQTTCFELFLSHSEGDTELNFSPSERWAAYRFSGHRDGMVEADVPTAPEITASSGEYLFVLTAVIDTAVLAGAKSAGISAVIEEKDGTKSYWALAHPPDEPDFHHPACFALPLPAAGEA